jgi:arylsulfatase A-like enzyme/Tfp pilus assembly protein PilF
MTAGMNSMATRTRLRTAGAGCLVALMLSACGDGRTPTFPKAPIVLISVDTLRSDRLPAYGFTGVATPAVDALREDGILFERAYSHTPLTLPSHASLFSGLLPSRHGVRDNSGYRYDAATLPHLPRLLKENGYTTGAMVSTFVLRAEAGLAADFDLYDSDIEVRAAESLGNSQRSGTTTAAAAKAWLRGVANQPFFLFLHLYEPHTPYAPPEPWKSRYADPYVGEIAAADAVVGDVVAELERLGVYDRAIVVLLSDHGEGLLDHGEQEHGIFLYREALQVPLVVKLPGAERAGETVQAPAQLVDVHATLLALAGIPAPDRHDGDHLLELERHGAPERSLYAETYYPRLHFGWSELTSLVAGSFQLIFGPDPELYDLTKDPAQRTNLRATERRRFAEMRSTLQGFEIALARPAQESEETAKQLAALGYLGGLVRDDPTAEHPDPKTRIHVLDKLARALHLASSERYQEAVLQFQEVAAINPRMLDAWESMGQCLQRLGRRQEALAAFQRAMEISGGVGHVAIQIGGLLLEMERFDEARTHAELGLPTSPAMANNLLAKIALARKDFAAAERLARLATAERGSRVGPLVTLATIQSETGRLQEALATTDTALADLARMEGDSKWMGLYLVRGDVLGRLGRIQEAEQAFLREIQESPGNTAAYTRLAALYASAGQPQAAVTALRRMVEAQESPLSYSEAVKTLRVLGDAQSAVALLAHARRRFPDSPELQALK